MTCQLQAAVLKVERDLALGHSPRLSTPWLPEHAGPCNLNLPTEHLQPWPFVVLLDYPQALNDPHILLVRLLLLMLAGPLYVLGWLMLIRRRVTLVAPKQTQIP